MAAPVLCVCVCGVPGSGKTTLCRALCACASRHGLAATHLEFDASLRGALDAAGGVFSPALWHKCADDYHELVCEQLRRLCTSKQTGQREVVLLDGTNELSSMRLAAARAALGACCAFAVVAVVPSSLAVAHKQNTGRPDRERVEPEALDRVAQRIEYPWDANHFWERAWRRVDTGAGAPPADEQAEALAAWLAELDMAPVVLVDPAKDTAAKAPRAQLAPNTKEQFEQWMRRTIGAVLAATEAKQRGTVAKQLAAIKKHAAKPEAATTLALSKAQQKFLAELGRCGLSVPPQELHHEQSNETK